MDKSPYEIVLIKKENPSKEKRPNESLNIKVAKK